MILNIENLFFSSFSQLRIALSFEIDPISSSQYYIEKAIRIVKILIEKYPGKIDYHSLWGFTIDFDIKFISLLLVYLILEFDVTVKINEIKINDKYINAKSKIKMCDFINEIQDLMIEFSKLEMHRISEVRKESIEALDLLENEYILL